MANGEVITGFSKPYVAEYQETDGVVTYSNVQPLARGVQVEFEPSSGDTNTFYADNVEAESEGGKFTGGTLTLTVDGLLASAERFIYGLPAAGADGWQEYDEDANAPFLGIGFIIRVMSGGVTSYKPVMFKKGKFDVKPLSAATQEEQIDWQTSELSAQVMRDDTTKRAWKAVGENVSTEALAEAALVAKLGGVSA